ncbi:MAG: monovalent cation/H+ antiporter subunit D family protein [Candidatus Rokubacteria bacterium]|nr:monovalent cation/H+ antiporter subunit D family protein [Candidatus Rokubacteria bacterium]
MPALALLPSLLAAVLIPLSARRPALREAWSVLAAGLQAALAIALMPAAGRGIVRETMLVELAPGLPLVLRADALGCVFAALSSGLWVLTTVYSIGYVRGLREHAQTRYFCAFALCLFATLGVAFAGNLLTFFLFYEILTIATYPLVIHKETLEAVRAGRMYLAYTLGAGVALFAAVAWTLGLAGTVEFRPGGILDPALPPGTLWSLGALFLLGVGVKAAVMPLHSWLPVAMIAPTPVSALLHAVAVVKAGVFGVVRVVGYVMGPDLLAELGAGRALAWLAAATILGASLLALAQDNLKRLLAFSTVSQLSYVVLGAALGTPSGLAGAIQHIVNHGVSKITLFFCAGAIYVATGKERVSELQGIGRRMPVTMGAFAVASLGIAGVPPAAGFLSKWYLIRGALEAEAWPFVLVLLASSLLNLAYFLPIIVSAFFRPGAEGEAVAEAPGTLVWPLVVTGAAAVWLGVLPDAPLGFWSLASGAAAAILASR